MSAQKLMLISREETEYTIEYLLDNFCCPSLCFVVVVVVVLDTERKSYLQTNGAEGKFADVVFLLPKRSLLSLLSRLLSFFLQHKEKWQLTVLLILLPVLYSVHSVFHSSHFLCVCKYVSGIN